MCFIQLREVKEREGKKIFPTQGKKGKRTKTIEVRDPSTKGGGGKRSENSCPSSAGKGGGS